MKKKMAVEKMPLISHFMRSLEQGKTEGQTSREREKESERDRGRGSEREGEILRLPQ